MNSGLKKTIVLLVLVTSLMLNAHGQMRDVISGQAEMPINDAISVEEQKLKLIAMAKSNALTTAYGLSITHMELLSQEDYSGETLNEDYSTFTETMSRGTWLADYEVPVINSFRNYDGNLWMRVKVKGFSRAYNSPGTTISANILSCPEQNCESTLFKDGQSFHLFFTVSRKGYVAVIVEDVAEKIVYPIRLSKSGFFVNMNPGQPLLFPDPDSPDYYYDLHFTAEPDIAIAPHICWFIFSEKCNGLENMEAKYENQLNWSSIEFRKYMVSLAQQDESITVEMIPVTVIN